MKKIDKKRNTEENPPDLREKGRETAQFFTISAVSKCFRAAFFLILSADTIRLSADILIAFENFLIVFLISQGENKICSIENNFCSIENKIPPIEIKNTPILVMAENAIFSTTDLCAGF